MLASLMTKPILGLTVGSATVVTAGGLAVFKGTGNKTSSHVGSTQASNNSEINENEELEGLESIRFTPVLPKYNFGVFKIADNGQNPSTSGAAKPVRCRLENEQNFEHCSLLKVVEETGKNRKWIDIEGLKKLAFNQLIPEGFFTGEKTIYQVRASAAFVLAWQSNTTKKLNIYSHEGDLTAIKPIITLDMRAAIKNGDKFRGLMQYMLVKAEPLQSQSSPLDISSKSFTCDYPGGTSEFKNCEFFHFYKSQTAETPIADDALQIPLRKAQTLTTGFNYLIKFDEAININSSGQETQGQSMNIKMYTDQARTQGAQDLTIKFISPVTILSDDGNVDFAFVF